LDSLIQILDKSNGSEAPLSAIKRKKLATPLDQSSEERRKDPAESGILEATGVDIAELLNEAFPTMTFNEVGLSKVQDLGEVVEIVHVKVNRDCSHADASWDSPFIAQFLGKVEKSFGAQDRSRIAHKLETGITSALQQREGKFRAFLARNMDFRRVPRVFFKVKDASFGLDRRRRPHWPFEDLNNKFK
jgi:ribosome-binding factor A